MTPQLLSLLLSLFHLLLLVLLFVDVDTCDPVPDALIDLWRCNARAAVHLVA
jgi:hypothetical protein